MKKLDNKGWGLLEMLGLTSIILISLLIATVYIQELAKYIY